MFEPLGRTGRELAAFQDTAHRLLEMERLGLIGRAFTEVREIAGTEFYDYVEYALPAVGQSPHNPSYLGIVRSARIPNNIDLLFIQEPMPRAWRPT